VDAYRQAIEVDGERPEAHTNLGAALHESENLQEANRSYQTALRLTPDHAGVHWNMALIAEQQGAFDEAEEHYKQVVASQPHWREAPARLSRLHY
jgi:tetratricopeptide (TPR) repeat protein